MEKNNRQALWHVGEGAMLFAGPLTYNAPHFHCTAIYIAGLYDNFRLRLECSDWRECRTAVIPAGVTYELDVGGRPIAVYYLEPNIAGVDALVPLLDSFDEIGGALIGNGGEISLIRELYEDPDGLKWADLALMDLVNFSKVKARKEIDLRVSHVIQSLYDQHNEFKTMPGLVQEVGLSASRFQHLFTTEMGIPFRRYRAWRRLKVAIKEVISGNNLTTAAQAAGYFDQAHFGHHFLRTFGAPPGKTLSQTRS